MRAARLLNLMLLLQGGKRMTAGELARRLEVSERTVLRDLEVLSGSGVPLYAIRGRFGGFEMLGSTKQPVPAAPPGLSSASGQLRRVRVRLSPAALQRALVLGQPEGWRPRPNPDPADDRPDWIEGSFRFDSYEAAVQQLLTLGAEVEVLLPVELRDAMAALGRRIAALHGDPVRPAAAARAPRGRG